jgi:hypothetical protein
MSQDGTISESNSKRAAVPAGSSSRSDVASIGDSSAFGEVDLQSAEKEIDH